MSQLTSQNAHKDIAVSFLTLVTSGAIREAYEQHIGPNFRHHNPYFRGDVDSLREGMEDNEALHPNKKLNIQRVLAQGDIVVVHSHVQLIPNELEIAAVHIFRFAGGKIVELWDVAQQIPAESPNEYGMF